MIGISNKSLQFVKGHGGLRVTGTRYVNTKIMSELPEKFGADAVIQVLPSGFDSFINIVGSNRENEDRCYAMVGCLLHHRSFDKLFLKAPYHIGKQKGMGAEYEPLDFSKNHNCDCKCSCDPEKHLKYGSKIVVVMGKKYASPMLTLDAHDPYGLCILRGILMTTMAFPMREGAYTAGVIDGETLAAKS